MLAYRERVVQEVLIPKFVTLMCPPDCAFVFRHFPLMLNSQSEISVILEAGNVFVPVDMLDHDAMVFEHLVIFVRVEMEMCLGENAPGSRPPMKGVGFRFFRPTVIISHGTCNFIDVNSRFITVIGGYVRCLVLR